MVSRVFAAFAAMDILFVAMGAIMLGFCVINQNQAFGTPTDGTDAAEKLLYQRFPLTAGIVNAIFIFVTFVATIPGMASNSRGWLKFAGFMITVCALFTLIIGLDLWIITLTSKEEFANFWTSSTAEVQEQMQTAFACCGYFNSTSPAFQTDATCPSPAAAALIKGCATPLTSFTNTFVDQIFTAVFGMVGIDALLILAIACLLKERKEMERFRFIDEKSGARSTF